MCRRKSQGSTWEGVHGCFLSSLRNRAAGERALLLELRHGSHGNAAYARQASCSAHRGPADRRCLPGAGAGQCVGCGGGAHFRGDRFLLFRRAGGGCLSCGLDRDSGRAGGFAGVSSKPMSGRYESDGAQLSYEETGSGTPVVFLHPTPLDHAYWGPLVRDLGAPIRAILPDFRGHGGSELGALPAGGFDACFRCASPEHEAARRRCSSAAGSAGSTGRSFCRLFDRRVRDAGTLAAGAGEDARAGVRLLQAAAGCGTSPGQARGKYSQGAEFGSQRALRRHGAVSRSERRPVGGGRRSWPNAARG